MAAPKEKQVGKTCESNERERTSQISRINTDEEAVGLRLASQAQTCVFIRLHSLRGARPNSRHTRSHDPAKPELQVKTPG